MVNLGINLRIVVYSKLVFVYNIVVFKVENIVFDVS